MKAAAVKSIAWLTVRDAVRSRLLASLTALLVTGLIGLPLLISGDDTLEGQLQVVLSYALSFASGMLALVTLWVACGGMATDLRDRRLYLVLTKPVHRYELWLGKWLGILFLNATLLALTGIILNLMVSFTLRTSSAPTETRHQAMERFLVAHEPLAVLEPDWASTAEQEAARMSREGRAPAELDLKRIQTDLVTALKNRFYTLPPEAAMTLPFKLPAPASGHHDLILRYSFESSRPERSPVPASWTVEAAGRVLVISVTNYPGIPGRLMIPGNLVSGAETVRVIFKREASHNPATIMLNAGDGPPQLMIPSGSGIPNLVRGLLMILFRLAFLAALGLTAGCLLSMPVALFAAFFVLVLLAFSGYVETVATTGMFFIPHEGPAPERTWINALVLRLFRLFNGVTQPLLRLDPVPLLQEGVRVSWLMTAQAAVWLLGLYTTITGLAGAILFNRREIG